MRTKLALVAVSGFAISAICLGGAFALGGNAIGNAVFDMGGLDLPRCDTTGSSSASTDSRSLPWDNSDRAAVALPANTHYQAGAGDQLVVKGDPRSFRTSASITAWSGWIVMAAPCSVHDSRIDVTLPGKRTLPDLRSDGHGEYGHLRPVAIRSGAARWPAPNHHRRRESVETRHGCERHRHQWKPRARPTS